MKPLDQFDALLSQARRETAPVVDVSEVVLASISKSISRQPALGLDRTLLWFAGTCALAASLMAMVTWQLLEQPVVAELLNPLVVPVMISQQAIN